MAVSEELSILLDGFQTERRRKRVAFAASMAITIFLLLFDSGNSRLSGYAWPLMLVITVDLMAVSRSIRMVQIIERRTGIGPRRLDSPPELGETGRLKS